MNAPHVWRTCAVVVILTTCTIAAGQPNVRLEREPGSRPIDLRVAGGHLYFIADDGFSGPQVWALDENEKAARQSLFSTGAGGSALSLLNPTGGDLLFAGPDGGSLYRTRTGDGPARKIAQAPAGSRIVSAGSDTENIYYLSQPSSGPAELWCVGVTGAPSNRYNAYSQGAPVEVLNLYQLLEVPGGVIYIQQRHGFAERTEFRLISDPAASASLLGDERDWVSGSFDIYAVGQGEVWYIASNDGLWRADLRSMATVRLLSTSDSLSKVVDLRLSDDRLFFRAYTPEAGSELWASDGTPEGTAMVRDIDPGVSGSGAYYLAPLRGGVCFVARDGEHGSELWYSDGTELGTYLVRDLIPGARSSEPYQLTTYGDHVYFSCYNDARGEELWRTDGTAAGTELLMDINPGAGSSEPYHLTVYMGALYFSATDGTSGFEIWRTRGTPETTIQVTRIRPPVSVLGSSSPRELTTLGDRVYFTANLPAVGRVLCSSDGSIAGTRPVLQAGGDIRPLNPRGLRVREGVLYYQSGPPESPTWWRHSEDSGAPLVSSTAPPEGSITLPGVVEAGVLISPGSPIKVGSRYVFSAYTPDHGIEPWGYDPDTGHFSILRDLFRGPASSAPSNFTVHDGEVYFSANTPHGGTELFKSDGTPGRVEQVWDLHPTPQSSIPHRIYVDTYGVAALVRLPGRGHEILSDRHPGFRSPPWLSPYLVPDEFAVAGELGFFVCDTPDTGAELWALAEDRVTAYLVSDLYPNESP